MSEFLPNIQIKFDAAGSGIFWSDYIAQSIFLYVGTNLSPLSSGRRYALVAVTCESEYIGKGTGQVFFNGLPISFD